ncbi:MAG: cellulase family glycosylhydrolase, partial [Ardenticatenales bacterium]|nr:cellulase family glycosylhydrolase [Ardenticatenales bacterium]
MDAAGHWFLDEHGRRLLLRGVNLGGSSKVPTTPPGATHFPTDFSEHRTASFVGRPFSLAEADEHFRRLRHWGFNCLRFLTTWEAIEHAGPGEYDEEYLGYLHEVVRRAGEYEFFIFIDPHQDVWSRMTGGDGAPGWTLELVGFEPTRLDASEAAITMQARYPDYGQMVWPNNWGRLASATMFTLFFGGEHLAPLLRVGDESIQSYLQRHFIGALRQVAERMRGLPHVIGYDSLNEPSRGYLGIARLSDSLPVYGSAPQLTGFESMIVGSGFPVEVPLIEQQGLVQRPAGRTTLNPAGHSAWHDSALDPWRMHGVWEVDASGKPHLLQDGYFAGFEFFRDGVRPFARRYAEALREVHPDAFLFIEGEPGAPEPLAWEDAPQERIVNASHWYDLLTLITKRYDPAACLVWGAPGETVTGVEAVRESFEEQIGAIVKESRRELQGVPTLIGEFGVPFDLNEKRSYRTEAFGAQAAALARYYDALDAHLAHGTLWNYTADNENEWGDGWNGEDLSIFSRSQQWNPYDLDSGGRALEGFVRPYVRGCAGTPTRMRFDHQSGEFELWVESEANEIPTELFVPRFQYQAGYEVE